MPGGCPTRKREPKLQPGLLEPCALKGARTVLRGRGLAIGPTYPTIRSHFLATRFPIPRMSSASVAGRPVEGTRPPGRRRRGVSVQAAA